MSKVFKKIGKAISSVVKSVVKAVTSVVKAVVDVVSSVVNFVTQPFLGALGAVPDVPSASQEAERQQGVLLQSQGSNTDIPVVYGYRKIGGTVVFAETGSTNNKYLWVAYVLSEGPVEGIRDIFIDDYQLPANIVESINSGAVTNVQADRYKDRTQLQFFPGVYFSNVNNSTLGTTVKNGIFSGAPSFKDTMDFNGMAVMFARYEWKDIKTQEDADNNPFSGSIPVLQVTMLGRKIASLTTSNPSQYSYDSAPIRYSTNPAEILLDYLRNPRYGKGLSNNDIDWTTWEQSAAKCNTEVTYVGSGIKGPILTCNFVLDTAQSILANTKTLLMNFRAYMPYVQGKYKLKIEDAGNPTDITSGAATIAATFTKDDLIGTVQYTGIEKSAKYNVVAVSYVDPDQKFSVQQVIYPETEAARQEYINLDGGRENKLEATFSGITNYAIAKDFARLLFNKSRRQETASITVSSKALELEPGDCIRFSANILDFGTTPWRIISFRLNDDLSVELGCVKNPDDIYPYTTVGEEDLVLPTYTPKGSSIYYPSVIPPYPIGLVPPTNAIQPAGYAPTTLVPATTPSPPSGNTDNTYPISPPLPTDYQDVVKFVTISYTDFNNGTYMYNLIFEQPVDSLYERAIFWWRADATAPYQEIKIETVSGSGGQISCVVGPLPRGVYEFVIRAYAADGRASVRILTGRFGYQDALANTPGYLALIDQRVVTVTDGWSVTTTVIPSAPAYADTIDEIYIEPELSGATRSAVVNVTQIKNVATKAINPLIRGVRIYHRLANTTYWDYTDYDFQPDYQPGATVTFTISEKFGAKVAPTNIIAYSANDVNQQYEFVARLKYADGILGTNIVGPGVGRVEQVPNNTGTVIGKIWGTTTDSNVIVVNGPLTEGFRQDFDLITQDPDYGYADISNHVPAIIQLFFSTNTNLLGYQFWRPDSTKFRGFRIRYRITDNGPPRDWVTVDSGILGSFDFIANKFTIANQIPIETGDLIATDYRLVYFDMVVTTLYTDGTDILEADDSLVLKWTATGATPLGSVYTLLPDATMETKNTKTAIEALQDTWDAAPYIQVKSWTKTGGNRFEKYNGTYYLNGYYTLKFNLPATSTGIVAYRRTRNPIWDKQQPGASLYMKTGPWERIRIAIGDLTTDSEGWKVLNLRGPIDWQYFSTTYTPATAFGNPLVRNIYGPSGQWPSVVTSPTLSGIYPLGDIDTEAETGPYAYDRQYAEYLFIIETSNVEQDNGILLKGFSSNSVNQPILNGFSTPEVERDYQIQDKTIYNTLFQENYGRRLSEYITAPATDKLSGKYGYLPRTYSEDSNPPSRLTLTGAYTIFAQGPRDGTGVV